MRTHTATLIAALIAVTLIAAPAAAQQQPTAPAPPPSSQPSVSPAPAGDAVARVEKVRADAVARRNARRVRVTLLDGSIATGRVVGVTDRDMAVQPTPSDEPVLLAFDQIDSISGAAKPRWVWTVVGVGIAAAVVGVIAAAN